MYFRQSRSARFIALASAAAAAIATPALAEADAPPAEVTVGDVVVTASLRPQPIEQLGTAVTVVGAEAIEQQQLTSLDEVLERVPGVTIIRSGGIGQNTQVRMRGFTTKHVLVMIDGVKLNNPSESDNQFGLEHVLLDSVERVEILRGPQSGIYGGDASAGVINVITRRPQGRPDLRLSGLYGSHDTYELSAGSMGRLDRFGYSASAAYYSTGGISLASRPPGNVEPDGYENLTLNTRADWDVTDTFNVEGWLRYTKARNDVDVGSLPAGNPLGLPPFLFQDSPGDITNEQVFAFVRGRLQSLGGRLVHEAKVSLVDVESTSVTPGVRQDSEGRTTEASYHATYDLGEGAFLLAGVERKKETGRFEQPTGGGFATVDDSISETGLFATATLSPVRGAFLSGAVRHDDNSLFGGNTTYRATLAYNLADGWDLPGVDTKFRASYGTGAEAPGLRQLLGSSPTYQGNPALTPESSKMWEIGLDQSLESGVAAWNITYYRGEATDGIFNVTNPATRISSPQNVDSPVRMEGLEFGLRVRPVSWLDVNASYTDSSSFLLSNRVQLFGRPKRQGVVAVTVRPTSRLALTADAMWRSEFFSDYPTNYEMPGYSLLNLTASFDVTEQVRVHLNVHNVFDKFYEEKLGDATYGRTAQVRVTAAF